MEMKRHLCESIQSKTPYVNKESLKNISQNLIDFTFNSDSANAIILKKRDDQCTLSSFSFLLEHDIQESPSCGPCGSGTSIMKPTRC